MDLSLTILIFRQRLVEADPFDRADLVDVNAVTFQQLSDTTQRQPAVRPSGIVQRFQIIRNSHRHTPSDDA
jgi:hypothetical protein